MDKMFTKEGNFNQSIKDLVKQGQNVKVKSCIKGMSPSKLVDSSKTSLLHLAARYNNCDLTKYLIKIKCNVNAANVSKTTPLMVAATSSSFKTAQILIEAKADVYTANLSNKSALELLLTNKKIPLYLIHCCLKKVQSNCRSDNAIAEQLFIANCPLNVVIHLKKASITRLIIKRYGQNDPQHLRAAMELSLKLSDKENVGVLLQSGMEIDISKSEAVLFLEKICLNEPCKKTNLKLIRSFLEKVTDWNALGGESLSPLNAIFMMGTKQCIELFLQHKVNDYVKNKFLGHDLCINTFGNHDPHARELLNHLKYDVHSHGEGGCTALHFAAYTQDLALAQVLLKSGANPNTKNSFGYVPLNCLRTFSSMNSATGRMIELLLQAGADPQLDMDNNDLFLWYLDFQSPIKSELMLAQLAIDESKGVSIRETIRQDISRLSRVKDVFESCCQQLEKLKSIKVQGSTTLYTVLITDPAKIADSLRDRETLEAIYSDLEIEQLCLYYASKLKKSVNQILHTIDLKMKASAFIGEASGFPSSQYIIFEKILSFFTYEDLLVFE